MLLNWKSGIIILILAVCRAQKLFPVSIVHINDFHARFEESDEFGGLCNIGNKCIGGYARVVTIVKQLLYQREKTNPIYLNAGDNFQGTLWYNIGKHNVTSYFLNLLPADAMTIGNHEFDDSIDGLVPFLENIKSPIVVANIDDSLEPTMKGKYTKSVIIEKYDRKIGVIGVILQTTDQIASTGKLKFLNESETVRAEAERLKNKENVDIIIVLSHCGLDVDRIIAIHGGPYIDVIVGGHSHTFLFSGEKPPGVDKPADKYPVIVSQGSGRKVLIVQASAYAKYIGDITVYFDETGDVVSWEGSPIYLDDDVIQDEEIIKELKPWKEIIDEKGNRKIGKTRVDLSKSSCNNDECNIGNFLNDAFLHEYITNEENVEGQWTPAAIALTNVGGIRTSLMRGDLTYGHIVTTAPFENTVDSFDLRGDYLLEALEYSVTNSGDDKNFYAKNMLQVSGLKVVYNITRPIGERVSEVLVRCQKCELPEFVPLDKSKMYTIVAASFLANGGDGFFMFRDKRENYKPGPVDINILVNYIEKMSPVYSAADERITVHT